MRPHRKQLAHYWPTITFKAMHARRIASCLNAPWAVPMCPFWLLNSWPCRTAFQTDRQIFYVLLKYNFHLFVDVWSLEVLGFVAPQNWILNTRTYTDFSSVCFYFYSNHLYLAVKGETGTSIQARPFHSTSVADLSYLAIVKKWKQSATMLQYFVEIIPQSVRFSCPMGPFLLIFVNLICIFVFAISFWLSFFSYNIQLHSDKKITVWVETHSYAMLTVFPLATALYIVLVINVISPARVWLFQTLGDILWVY